MANEIFLYDEIGPARWGLIDAKLIIDALAEIGARNPVTLRINSPGGHLFEADAIAKAIERHKGEVTGVVDSLAASAASFILQACDVRQMTTGSHQMVHGPHSIAIGNKIAMRDAGDRLERFEGTVAAMYRRNWKLDEADLVDAMESDETWFSADEAVDAGIADEVLDDLAIAACLPEGLYSKLPPGLTAGGRTAKRRANDARRRVAGEIVQRRQWLDVRQQSFGLTGRKRGE